MLQHKIRQLFPNYTPLDKYKYKDIISNFYTSYDYREDVYPSIIPNWDRSPRAGRRAVIYTGSTPALFEEHIKKALEVILQKQDQHKILFLRSWNEWAEGNYVEPDLKFGHGYLDVLKSSILMK